MPEKSSQLPITDFFPESVLTSGYLSVSSVPESDLDDYTALTARAAASLEAQKRVHEMAGENESGPVYSRQTMTTLLACPQQELQTYLN